MEEVTTVELLANLIGQWCSDNGERLWQRGAVVRRAQSYASVKQSGKQRVSESVGVKERARGAFVPIVA